MGRISMPSGSETSGMSSRLGRTMSKNHRAGSKPAARRTAVSPTWDSQLHEPNPGEALALREHCPPDAPTPPGRVDDAVEAVLAVAVGRVDDLPLGDGDDRAV